MALRDAVLGPLILTLWAANYKVYGVHKMWKAMHRSGEPAGNWSYSSRMAALYSAVNVRRRGRAAGSGSSTRPLCRARVDVVVIVIRASWSDLAL